jgi:hypothetical protein
MICLGGDFDGIWEEVGFVLGMAAVAAAVSWASELDLDDKG